VRYFTNIEPLVYLEKQERWEKARELLYKKWINEKTHVNNLIRLLSECWYILTNWDNGMNNDPDLSFQTVHNTLIECTAFGLQRFANDQRFLCVAGYMISLFPYLFYANNPDNSTDALYTEWEQKGIAMLQKAYEINPTDKVTKVLNLGNSSNLSSYNEAKIALQPEIEDAFPGETAIELYFKDILSI